MSARATILSSFLNGKRHVMEACESDWTVIMVGEYPNGAPSRINTEVMEAPHNRNIGEKAQSNAAIFLRNVMGGLISN